MSPVETEKSFEKEEAESIPPTDFTTEPLGHVQSRQSHLRPASTRRGQSFAGLYAGLNEENFDRQAEVEMQQLKNERSNHRDPNLVDWEGPDDPGNPQNWPVWKKWIITVSLGTVAVVVTFASSIFSTATQATAELFGVSDEVMILGTSLFVVGFTVGPMFWGPLSELYVLS